MKVSFDGGVKLEFHGAMVTSDGDMSQEDTTLPVIDSIIIHAQKALELP